MSRILIIDDDINYLDCLYRICQRNTDSLVKTINNVKETLNYIAENIELKRYEDYVFCDLNLNDKLNGIDILTLIYDNYENKPDLYLVTGAQRPNVLDELQYINYISKPYSLTKLKEIVKNDNLRV